jgi:lipopolysaccharide biosynthesis glycosyltransferase
VKVEIKQVRVVLASDIHYLMPLAVAICSAALHCDRQREIVFSVIQHGIDAYSRSRVESSLQGIGHPRTRIEWVDLPVDLVAGIKLALKYTTPLTFARLLIPDLLPVEVEEAIYLDCDVVVMEDLCALLDLPLAGRSLLAARDFSTDTVSNHCGIANFRELGIPADARYFNAGVLLVNLRKWRESRTSEKLLEYLKTHHAVIQMADQEALNAVLFDDWGELDYRWNWQIPWRKYRNGNLPMPWMPAAGRRSIIHFTTSEKPWLPGCDYEDRRIFFQYLDRTAWSGWRVSWAREVHVRCKRALGDARDSLGLQRRRWLLRLRGTAARYWLAKSRGREAP